MPEKRKLAAARFAEARKQDGTIASSIRYHFSIDGLIEAIQENPVFDVSHQKISRHPYNTTGKWFPSASTAVGARSQGTLWSYRITDDIVSFLCCDTFLVEYWFC